MPLRFYRRVPPIPGLRLNASRGGLSLSVGRRGAMVYDHPRGRRMTIAAPFPGLYWTEQAPATSRTGP
jgi:hypothetical protein